MAHERLPKPRTRRFRLSNGLSVVLAPSDTSPTASVWVWYRVGSKNEHPGITGASHWVEHMLFQGSPRYGKGEIDRAVVSVGGELNAFTDYDFTAYFTTVPREHLDLPLDFEADRMTRALITDREVERERTVILSEREGNENWPEFRAEEELYELSFRWHPYRWDALGRRRDIERMSPEELRQYYRRFYGTSNAVLVVTGGFSAAAIERRVRRTFGRLPAGGEDPLVSEVEPAPTGPRRSELAGPGTTPFLLVGFRAPAVSDADAPATMMVDLMLGGETPLFSAASGWGRSREHPDSRLYRGLIDTGLAVRAGCEWRPHLHPGLFTVHVQAAEGVDPDRLERATVRILEELAEHGPTEEELRAARLKLRRSRLLAYEGASRTGFRLGYLSMLGDGLEEKTFARLVSAGRREVRERAEALLRIDRSSVVRFAPAGKVPDA